MPVPEGQGLWSGTPNFKYVWLGFKGAFRDDSQLEARSLPGGMSSAAELGEVGEEDRAEG
jgi:hypothetical protein